MNWLFMPGGPGVEGSYYDPLIEGIDLPGTIWFIDFPGNGINIERVSVDYDFDNWFDLFLPCISQFENPVFLGHSFSGMFPLLFPELEYSLEGLVILNSAPSLWFEEAFAYARDNGLPDISSRVQQFIEAPSDETFKGFLDGALPYFFPLWDLKRGREFLAQVYWRFQAAVWWQHKAVEINFSAKWIPQRVPTLIICGSSDGITPATLFQRDKRFKRANIEMCLIEDAGHFSWIDQPEIVKGKLREFASTLVRFP